MTNANKALTEETWEEEQWLPYAKNFLESSLCTKNLSPLGVLVLWKQGNQDMCYSQAGLGLEIAYHHSASQWACLIFFFFCNELILSSLAHFYLELTCLVSHLQLSG